MCSFFSTSNGQYMDESKKIHYRWNPARKRWKTKQYTGGARYLVSTCLLRSVNESSAKEETDGTCPSDKTPLGRRTQKKMFFFASDELTFSDLVPRMQLPSQITANDLKGGSDVDARKKEEKNMATTSIPLSNCCLETSRDLVLQLNSRRSAPVIRKSTWTAGNALHVNQKCLKNATKYHHREETEKIRFGRPLELSIITGYRVKRANATSTKWSRVFL